MGRVVTYLLVLEVDVAIEGEIPREMDFGRYVENGTIYIDSRLANADIVDCLEVKNACNESTEEE